MLNPLDNQKRQELFFAEDPPGQAERALQLLQGLEGLRVDAGSQANSLIVSYSLLDYSMEGLETALVKEGYILDNSLMREVGRKLAYYKEEMQYHNMSTPERQTKSRTQEIFVKAYDTHPHGDHDDTPEELRDYK